MNYFRLTLLAVLSLVLFSCQKEVDSSILSSPGGNNGGGNTGSYQPLSSGSWWKYKDSTSGTISTLSAINTTKTINNILYRGLKSSQGTMSDTAFQAAPSPNYFLYQKGVSPNSGAPYDLLFHYLNDSASVGYNWTYNAGQGNGFTAFIKTTIIEKGITITVGSNTFSNVIHTKLDFAYDIMGTVMDFGFYDFYVARNVGIVRVRAEIGSFGFGLKTCSDLIDYHIQ